MLHLGWLRWKGLDASLQVDVKCLTDSDKVEGIEKQFEEV